MDPVTGGIFGGSALLQLFGANQASGAARDASGLQAQAAREAAQLQAQAQREALGFQRDVYNQGRADQQPWIEAGQGGVSKLAHLMGIPMGGSGGGGFAPLQAPARQSPMALAPGTDLRQPTPFGDYTGGRAAPRSGDLPVGRVPLGTVTRPGGSTRTVRSNPTGQSGMGGLVMMTGPDGSQQAVPEDQVDHFLSLGAKVSGS